MSSSDVVTLRDALSKALPSTFTCKTRYVRTLPKRCDALFSPTPGSEPEKTRLSSHFLTISIKLKGSDVPNDVFALGIEVLIYHTKHLTTIFVSKADSTGYLPQQRPSPVQRISTAFLRWLSAKERQNHPKRELVISLFARSQSQYLFPGSADNKSKHILDDRQLIKWWARVLDPLFPTEPSDLEYKGYITVPGYEGMEVRPFFPPSAQSGKRWHPGNPLIELAGTRGVAGDAPPRCLLPRFPDDPKARFMQDLDDEVGFSEDTMTSPSKRKTGKWKSIWNVDRFWEAMEFRQECSSGRMVGFLWVVIDSQEAKQVRAERKLNNKVEEGSQESLADTGTDADTPRSKPSSQHDAVVKANGSPSRRRRKPLTGLIVPRQPRLKGGSSSLTATSGLDNMVTTALDDGVVLSKEGYGQAMQSLLHLDFAGLEVATQSTAKWAKGVSDVCGIQADWALDVTGSVEVVNNQSTNASSATSGINDLGGMVRKKRKADTLTANGESAAAETKIATTAFDKPTVNMLSGGMIKKKPKAIVS